MDTVQCSNIVTNLLDHDDYLLWPKHSQFGSTKIEHNSAETYIYIKHPNCYSFQVIDARYNKIYSLISEKWMFKRWTAKYQCPSVNAHCRLNKMQLASNERPRISKIRVNDSKATTHTHTHTRLTALCPGLPRSASTRKVKQIWILLKQETVSGSGISWATCKSAPCSRQITTPAPHHSVFYRPDALPAAQPTASKHWSKATTHTHLTALFLGLPSEPVPERQSQSGFYWSKRQWVAVASAGPYANLHLAPDR